MKIIEDEYSIGLEIADIKLLHRIKSLLLIKNYQRTSKFFVEVKNLIIWKHNFIVSSSLSYTQKASQRLNTKDIQ